MSVRVSVVDLETGDTSEQIVPDGDYMILTTEPCYVDGIQSYANGTHVLTVKGRRERAERVAGVSEAVRVRIP